MPKTAKAKKETVKKMTSAPEKALTKSPKALPKVAAKALVTNKKIAKPTPTTGKVLKATKADKKSEKIEAVAEVTPATENNEDEEDEIADAAGGGAQSGMALAAATAETAAGSLKNFRHHPDIENFYRFIFENDLRYEALEFIDVIASQREVLKKTLKTGGKSKH